MMDTAFILPRYCSFTVETQYTTQGKDAKRALVNMQQSLYNPKDTQLLFSCRSSQGSSMERLLVFIVPVILIIDYCIDQHTVVIKTLHTVITVLNKPYVNEVTLSKKNLSLKVCQSLE